MWRRSAAAAPGGPPPAQPSAPPPVPKDAAGPAKEPAMQEPSPQPAPVAAAQAAGAATPAAKSEMVTAPAPLDATNKAAQAKEEEKESDDVKLLKALQALAGEQAPPKKKAQQGGGFLSGMWKESPTERLNNASRELRLSIRRVEIDIRRLQTEEERQWDALIEARDDNQPAPKIASMAETLAGTRARIKTERAHLARLEKQRTGISSVNETKLQMDVMRASTDALNEHLQNNDVDSVMELANEFTNQQMAQAAVRDAIEMANDDDGDNDDAETVSPAAQRILDSLRKEEELDYLPHVPYHAPGSLNGDRRLAERYGS